MKSKLLSLIIACGVVVCLLAASYALRQSGGAAQASGFSLPGNVIASNGKSAARLRRDISISPDKILEVSGRDVYATFDRPELVRQDLPTVVWQYRSESCVLDVYFTASGSDVMKSPVVHYEMRGRDVTAEGDVQPKVCAESIVDARSGFHLLNFNALYKPGL